MDTVQLTEYCRVLAQASEMAQKWVGDNGDLVKNDAEGLLSALRAEARVFRKCGRALERKMCAGVFGPSQAGKSYLLSALARDKESGSLGAVFADRTLDFISEINPEGGKESTGLVTRFTMTRPATLPDGSPVYLRLLTETDLVKIIANAYYADCEHKDSPDEEAIRTAISAIGARAGKECCRLTIDDMEELHEYIREFRASPRVQSLERLYWNRASEIMPRLGEEDRVALYAVIWDSVPQFTSLLRLLLSALSRLDFAEDAYCSLDALTPRETSIIDVATLGDLGSEGGSLIEVTAAGGTRAALPRAVVTALTAELTIVMAKKPADFFDHTDLLDFPGYRSRYKITDIARELAEKPAMTTQLFLRGKVAYLFQRYCAEKELTSMLLCIGPSNQEVQDLPAVINSWIETTHGKDAAERSKCKQDSLFFILTKFDMEFEQKMGASDTRTRWDNRLHASLLDFFGKQHDWPAQWKEDSAFNNIFLLRNPNFRFDSILEIDENNHETGIRENKKEYVESLHTSFVESALVRRHFADPEASWNAAMALNDGGIGYIRHSLSPLCDPDIKRRQMENTVAEARDILIRRLGQYYFSDDKQDEIVKKKQFWSRLFALLSKKPVFQHRFGELLHYFSMTADDIYELFPEAERRYSACINAESESVEENVYAENELESFSLDMLNDAFGSSGEGEKPVEAPRVKDEHTFFAEYIISRWIARMFDIAQSAAMQRYYAFPAQEFTAMVSELKVAAERTHLQQRLEDHFRDIARPVDVSREDKARKQAAVAAILLNDFVCWLGKKPGECTPSERTVEFNGEKASVFADLPPVNGLPVLEDSYRPYTGAWYRDWLLVFHAALMENVNFDGENMFNREQNALLGNILSRIKGEEAR